MRNFMLLALFFGIFACKQTPSSEVSVKLKAAEGKAFLSQLVKNVWVKLDSAKFKNGECRFNRTVKIPEVNYLSVSSKDEKLPFFIENSVITITGSIDSIDKAKVSGSKTQDEYQALQDNIDEMSRQIRIFHGDKLSADNWWKMYDAWLVINGEYNAAIFGKINRMREDYINANPASYVSPYLLNLIYGNMEADVLNRFLSGLDAKLDSVSIVINLKAIAAKRQTVAIGQIAPDFTMNDAAGNPVKLSDVYSKNTYTLIDFWASWCSPCRQENPNVLAIFNSYKTKGFGVIGVASEDNKEAWVKAIADDHLSWIQVSDLKGFKNAAVGLYDVDSHGIPYNYLVDKTGKIVARDLHKEKLRETIAGLLK